MEKQMRPKGKRAIIAESEGAKQAKINVAEEKTRVDQEIGRRNAKRK